MLAPVLALALAAGPRIAVMSITPGAAVSPPEAAAMTQSLVSEVRRRSGAEVITEREISSVLSLEQQKRILGCSTDACMAELGGALGVGRLVTGDVAKLGESLLVNLRVVDAVKVRVVSQSDRRLKKGSYDDLLDALPAMVSELFPDATASAPPPAPPAPRAPPAKAAKAPPLAAPARPEAEGPRVEGTFTVHLRGWTSSEVALVAWSVDPVSGFKDYVTQYDRVVPPDGATDFGPFWRLPAAAFRGRKANVGFVLNKRLQFGEAYYRSIGIGVCGAFAWSLAESTDVWIDSRDCQPRRTPE